MIRKTGQKGVHIPRPNGHPSREAPAGSLSSPRCGSLCPYSQVGSVGGWTVAGSGAPLSEILGASWESVKTFHNKPTCFPEKKAKMHKSAQRGACDSGLHDPWQTVLQHPPAHNLLKFLGRALDGCYQWQQCPQNSFVEALCPTPGAQTVSVPGDGFPEEVAEVK